MKTRSESQIQLAELLPLISEMTSFSCVLSSNFIFLLHYDSTFWVTTNKSKLVQKLIVRKDITFL